MIIDPTDFLDKPYKIPNQEENRDFAAFLESTEEQLAIEYLLGRDLWEDLNEEGSDIDPDLQKIIDGDYYTYSNKEYHYRGWVDMIRPAIFSLWIPETTYKLTNIGFVENAAPDKVKLIEDTYPFQVKHWNDFVAKAGNNYPYSYSYKHTFYGFMQANKSIYPDWRFKAPKFKNRFDL